ncbi:MarR family winged helix-turn-helix transcriptional regulator [Aquimarina hainanensis]|uniref:MarR family winged helix-turn-helix transcriptional regulator n=1 Tax=Aquimarina hainanensis TaxID=1578017 RepID=A0ABW5N9C0_9FLAO|nr:MarR family transcriptional regulator [Aquimarina sp. TRL1]QKX03461.1 MarR family transcriptional regulator [Aquimarina sp. TRL1]
MKIEELLKVKGEFPIEQKVIVNLLYTGNWANENISNTLKAFDISIQQFNVLRILKGQNGKAANLSTIQERMISKMSNTTRLIDKLVTKGLVTRITCPTNRRKIEITITREGLSLLEIIHPIIIATEKRLTSKLTKKEQETLNLLLDKLKTQ